MAPKAAGRRGTKRKAEVQCEEEEKKREEKGEEEEEESGLKGQQVLIEHCKSQSHTLDGSVQRAPGCSFVQAAEFTNSILNMLITDMQPLSMVEDEGFQKMISTFNPDYVIPSRSYFVKMVEEKCEEVKDKLRNILKETDSIALTIDIWTSVATEAYLGVTCHFLGEDWKMESHRLTTMLLEERHTAANIAEWLEDAIAKFDVPPENIKAVVHDNGANIVAAVKILTEKHKWASVQCAGQALNWVVQNTLKKNQSISECLAAARCLVEHFKESEVACMKLKAKQQQMGAASHMLIQDESTCWISTFHMLSRLLEQRWPITAALSDPALAPSGKHHLDLEHEQWDVLEEVSKVLEPFEEATAFLNGQDITLSALPQFVHSLKKSIQAHVFETGPAQSYRADVMTQITTVWEELFVCRPQSSNTVLLSAALDPRFIKLKFLPPDEVFKIKSMVQTMALDVKKKMRRKNSGENEVPNAAQDKPVKHQRSNTSFISNLLCSSDSSTSDEEDEEQHLNLAVQKEVLIMYFGEHALSRRESPLLWWKSNASRYPTLSKLAKSFLCVPATCASKELLFPAAGNVASKRRASLGSEHVDMIMFLHCNRSLL